jgi:hypothetical protein
MIEFRDSTVVALPAANEFEHVMTPIGYRLLIYFGNRNICAAA